MGDLHPAINSSTAPGSQADQLAKADEGKDGIVLLLEPLVQPPAPEAHALGDDDVALPPSAAQEPAAAAATADAAADSVPVQEQAMAREGGPAAEGLAPTLSDAVEQQQPRQENPCWDKVEPWVFLPVTRNQWICFLISWASIIGLLVWAVVWAFPKVVDSAYDPTVASVERALTRVQIGVIVSVACMVLPWTIVLPPDPFVWAAASIFNFGEAFAMVLAGSIPAMAVPFLAVRFKLGGPMLRFLHRYDKTKAILLGVRKAGPFATVLIIRLGPVPYGLANYLLGLPEALDFWRYISASILGLIPSIVVSIIFGRNIKGLSDMLQGESVPAGQLAVNLVSLFSGIILLLGGWWYAKRVLDEMEKDAAEEQRQRAASRRAAQAAGGAASAADGGNAQADDAAAVDVTITIREAVQVEQHEGDAAGRASSLDQRARDRPTALQDGGSQRAASAPDLTFSKEKKQDPLARGEEHIELSIVVAHGGPGIGVVPTSAGRSSLSATSVTGAATPGDERHHP